MLLTLLIAGAMGIQGGPCQPSSWCAGTAKVEITPPPGFPTGGHGPAGDSSRGYWNRLYARAFYIGTGGKGIVLVSVDFFAFPIGLHNAVWKRVEEPARALGLRQGDLIVVATHTHQGPGNYLSAQTYNGFGSSDEGFSQELFDFMARRIGDAVTKALTKRQAASLKLDSTETTPDYRQQFILNRSPHVFQLNWDRENVLEQLNKDRPPLTPADCRNAQQDGEPSDAWDLPGCPRLRAVDRRMTVLEMLSGSSHQRIGALVFFAIHPTALVHSAPIYNSDVTGQALDALEAEWGGGAVVGFFNGGEGDITVRRVRRDIIGVAEYSRQFLAAIKDTITHPLTDPVPPRLVVHARVFDSQDNSDRRCPSTPKDFELAPAPKFGAAGVGGGEGDRTVLYQLGFSEGVHDQAQDHQGPKLAALDSRLLRDAQLTSAFAKTEAFPRYLPVSYVEVGTFGLGFVPVEMSTTGALHIRNDMEARGGTFQLVGLANEYTSYAATESEYAAQDYMGASTLWGPEETDFLRCRLLALRAHEPDRPFTVPSDAMRPGPPPRKHGFGQLLLSLIGIATRAPFGPSYVGDARELPDDGMEEILRKKSGAPERQLPFFEWDETIVDESATWDVASHRTIEIDAEDGTPVDQTDRGFLKVMTRAPDPKGPVVWHWAAIWLDPLGQPRSARYRFKVTFRVGSTVTTCVSDPFSVTLDAVSKPHGAGRQPCVTREYIQGPAS